MDAEQDNKPSDQEENKEKENDVVSEKKDTTKDLKYSKSELISNEKYLRNRDILSVLLKRESLYSFKETDELLNKFMKGRV